MRAPSPGSKLYSQRFCCAMGSWDSSTSSVLDSQLLGTWAEPFGSWNLDTHQLRNLHERLTFFGGGSSFSQRKAEEVHSLKKAIADIAVTIAESASLKHFRGRKVSSSFWATQKLSLLLPGFFREEVYSWSRFSNICFLHVFGIPAGAPWIRILHGLLCGRCWPPDGALF